MMAITIGAVVVPTDAVSSCAQEIHATATASRLPDLPPEIREDLARISNNEMAESGSPILQTDAPSKAEAKLPTVRFMQAILVKDLPRAKDIWFVSFEVSMSTPRTVGYYRSQSGYYTRAQLWNFGGPPCEAIKAALKGGNVCRIHSLNPPIAEKFRSTLVLVEQTIYGASNTH
jgi:hypothetical protein